MPHHAPSASTSTSSVADQHDFLLAVRHGAPGAQLMAPPSFFTIHPVTKFHDSRRIGDIMAIR